MVPEMSELSEVYTLRAYNLLRNKIIGDNFNMFQNK